jgi:hypothetical protein
MMAQFGASQSASAALRRFSVNTESRKKRIKRVFEMFAPSKFILKNFFTTQKHKI